MSRRPISECHFPWEWLLVDISGRARPCRWAARPVGHLKDQKIEDVWNGPDMIRLRGSIRDGYIDRVCRNASCHFVRDTEQAFGIDAYDFRIPLDAEVTVNDKSDIDYGVSGWSRPESWGRWTEGPEATLRFDLGKDFTGACQLHLRCRAAGHALSPERSVKVLVDDREIETWRFSYPDGVEKSDWKTLNIPADAIAHGKLEILLRIVDPVSPKSWGVDDGRMLGFGLSAIKASAANPN